MPGPLPPDEQPVTSGLAEGDDGKFRTPWAVTDPLLLGYYDREWGMPVKDERGLFERFCLETFQSGLSWLTILRKRDAFRTAFRDFSPDDVAALSDADVEVLMQDAGIVRNRRKIEAARTNAKSTVAMRDDGGLVSFVWSFQPDDTPRPLTTDEVPVTSPESIALAKALRKRGFSFVGPINMFALMEAIGMVDTHLMGSHRRATSGIWPS